MKDNVTDHRMPIFPVSQTDNANGPDQETGTHPTKKVVDAPIADPAGKPENFIPFEEL